MRIKLSLDPEVVTHQRMLIHGASNAGKTFLAGSALRYYQAQGKSVRMIDTVGEEGTRVITDMGIGEGVAETISTYDDFAEIIAECTKEKTDLLVVDSLKFVWKFIMLKVLKSDRAPVISKTSTDWTDLYRMYDKMLIDLVGAAKDLIVLCPSDISMNELKAEMQITPDLPGRKRTDTVSCMDMVGYLECTPMGSKTRRVVNFQGKSGVITKLRARKPVDKGFVLEEGVDCFATLQKELDEVV